MVFGRHPVAHSLEQTILERIEKRREKTEKFGGNLKISLFIVIARNYRIVVEPIAVTQAPGQGPARAPASCTTARPTDRARDPPLLFSQAFLGGIVGSAKQGENGLDCSCHGYGHAGNRLRGIDKSLRTEFIPLLAWRIRRGFLRKGLQVSSYQLSLFRRHLFRQFGHLYCELLQALLQIFADI
jgi:hypothetical protein